MTNTQNSSNSEKTHVEEFVSFSEMWKRCMKNWQWFVASVLLSMTLAVVYMYMTPKMYSRQMTVMVNNDNNGKSMTNEETSNQFSQFGLVQQTVNIHNVPQQLSSLSVLVEVAKKLKMANDANAIEVAKGIRSRLNVILGDDATTIVTMHYDDYSVVNAERVLTTIVEVANAMAINEKLRVNADATSFINDCIKNLESELGVIDDSIQAFKSKNRITDLTSVSEMYLQQQSQSDADVLRLTNQIAMARYMLDILRSSAKDKRLLPTNTGIENPAAKDLIAKYNEKLLELNSHMPYTSRQNPLIINQEREIESIKNHIIQVVENHIKTINIELEGMTGYNESAMEKIESNPTQEKHLATIERQQKIKESLYLYLLQKRSENDLQQRFLSNNFKVLDVPNGSNSPSSPVWSKVVSLALLIGFIIPLCVVLLRSILDNKVYTTDDINRLTDIPLLGSIPMYSGNNGGFFKRRTKSDSGMSIVVEYAKNDAINEAFRMLRTSMEFLVSGNSGRNNVFAVTSAYPGSGKTFVSMNLAVVLALKGHKVLYIDGDLRMCTASRYWGNSDTGISAYLNEMTNELDDIVIKHQAYSSLHIIPVGALPPNPTELLSNGRLKSLFLKAKDKYEYVIVDCPPVNVTADASIITDYTNRTLFVVKSGVFEKSRMAVIEELFTNAGQRNVNIILNAVQEKEHEVYGLIYQRQ